MKRLAACLLLVALAGCAAPVAQDDVTGGQLGEVENVTAGQNITVSPDDGLRQDELERLTRRAMARIELIRGLDYNETVDVEVISRAEYRNQTSIPLAGGGQGAERNVFWEALFLIGEDRDAGTVLSEVSGTAVQGYFSPPRDIVIVSDAARPTVNPQTLVHELVHALQEQQFGLGASTPTHDERQGYLGTIEGEAEHVTAAYFARCDVQWRCVDVPAEPAPDDRDHPGIDLVFLQPYVSGPAFIAEQRERRGWAAVDGLHRRYPNSSSEVIHPDRYRDWEPVDVTQEDRSGPDWETVPDDGTGERVGEGALFAMLAQNDAIGFEGQVSYDHPFTNGWAGDRLLAYESDNDSLGYVWTTEWQTEKDAAQFHHAYLELLNGYDATERGEEVYTVPEGSFADAFRVTLDGTTVRIVNAPTVEDLSAVRAPA